MIRPMTRSSKRRHSGTTLKGQAILEYAILLGIVTAALLGMQLYAKRSLQATVKFTADQIGNQADGIRYEGGERQNKVVAEGQTRQRVTAASSSPVRTQNTQELDGGGQLTTTDEINEVQGAVTQCGDGGCPPGTASFSQVVIDVR